MQTSDLHPQPTTAIHSRWRRIITPFPVPESIPIIERLRAVEPKSNAGLPPVLWDQAEGFTVRDHYGNQWIDMTSAIMLTNIGHAHPKLIKAIHQAADHKLITSYAFPSEARLKLLEKLVQISPIHDSKAILFSTGTEATETAMMLMRRHGQQIHPEKRVILSFENGYHGRTLAATLASGSRQTTDWITRESVHHHQIPFPFAPTCPANHLPPDDCNPKCFHRALWNLENQAIQPEHIAGIIVEPMPGWATWPIANAYAREMQTWARKHDILICFDEVQSGCGRTGKLFACEHLDIIPDLMTLGKGLSSSLPVSAVIGNAQLLDGPAPGEMSSTHGGNPFCAQVALANLQILEDECLVEASEKTGKLLLDELNKLKQSHPSRLLSIHGRGLFISAHLKRPDNGEPDIEFADAIVAEAVRRGVLMFVTGRGFIKFSPPLCIEPEAAIEAAEVIRDCFFALAKPD